MKKKTVEDELESICENILDKIERWKNISQNGCNDPEWPDGANMNLLRNHIIYLKMKLYDLCEKNEMKLPNLYYISTPPEVDNCYMAGLKQRGRVERLKKYGHILKKTGTKYDEEQMSLF